MIKNPATNIRSRRPHRRRRSSSACSHGSVHNPPIAARQWGHRSSPRELAGLRFLVLSHIQELEKKLEKLEYPLSDIDTTKNGRGGELTATGSPGDRPESDHVDVSSEPIPSWDSEFDFSVDDLRQWVRDSLDQLAKIRSEVSARLPDLDEVRSHFPDFDFDFELPHLSLDEFRARLSRVEVPNLSDVKTRIGDLGFEYLPTLSDHLRSLNAQLSSSNLPSRLDFPSRTLEKGNKALREFIDDIMYNEEDTPSEKKRIDLEVEQTVVEVQRALRESSNGEKLLTYEQLPFKWRNNEHVIYGYRFIPLKSWPSLLMSTFHLHNETANIHTHLIPFLVLGALFFGEAYLSPSPLDALPTTLFSIFSMLCLLTSVGWHIFAGCADFVIMETAARIDYLGIGWLISASIATVVYYGFSCRSTAFTIYISGTILAGVAGTILPLMQWFNERKHKKWRIVFFLFLSLTGFIPIVHLCTIHSASETLQYIAPIVPSLASYVLGLVFYAFHFPECWVSRKETGPHWTDWVGSHAIWHVCIVMAIWLHRTAIAQLAKGIGGEQCDVWGRY